MVTRFTSRAALAAGLLLGGCGSDGVGDGGNDLGSGTQTLTVQATVEAESVVPNGDTDNDFATSFEVRVRRGDVDVPDATVVIESTAGTVTLTWQGDGEHYRGSQVGYHEVYALDVDAGDDHVHGVQLDGPDLHVFTKPDASAPIDATLPLEVTWSRDEQAEVAGIKTRETDRLTIADTGLFTISPGDLESSPDQTEEEEIRVWRANQLAPAGGAGGSSFEVRIENYVDLVVAPTGL